MARQLPLPTTATQVDEAVAIVNADGSIATIGGSGTSSNQVQGAGPSGATAVGNPVGVGGVYTATLPTLTDGQRGNLMQDARGATYVSLANNGAVINSGNGTFDNATSNNTGIVTNGYNRAYGSTGWDRLRTIQGIDTTGLGVQASGIVGKYTASPSALTDGQYAPVLSGSRGQSVTTIGSSAASSSDGINSGYLLGLDLATGANRLPAVGTFCFNGSTWDRAKKPNLTARLVSAGASTNATSVKASTGDMFHVTGYNTNAAARYLKLYNKASAPTVGTDTPIWTEYLAPSARFAFSFPTPLYFGTGIAYAITTGAADADTGALTAGDIVALNIAYA